MPFGVWDTLGNSEKGTSDVWAGSPGELVRNPLGLVPGFALALLVTLLLTAPLLTAGHPTLCCQGWSLIPPSNPRCLLRYHLSPEPFLTALLKNHTLRHIFNQFLFFHSTCFLLRYYYVVVSVSLNWNTAP